MTIPAMFPIGTTVAVDLTLETLSDTPVTIYLRGRALTYDLVVADSVGRVVWRKLRGAVVPGILRAETLHPGRAMVWSTPWNGRGDDGQPLAGGRYALWAELPTDADAFISPRVSFEVTPD